MESEVEAEFLELAGRPGMEALLVHKAHCGYNFEGYGCTCKAEPLPEAERLGALVRVALANGEFIRIWPCEEQEGVDVELEGNLIGTGSTPEAALTRALLAAKTNG